MRPINEKGFQDVNGTGNITWTGPCISCLDIKTGDNLNAVLYAIATKVCELTAPLDLSTLSLQCALDIFNKEETGNRTLANVFQLLIDNECGLKELIDGLQSQIDGIAGETLILDLKCLAEKDSYGNSLPYTQKTVLQTLINNICSLTDSISDLSGKYTTLKNLVDNLSIPSGDEVVVTTCISSEKPTSQAVIELANDYCDYKQDVGTSAQIQTAIARQVAEFNTLMSGVAGWVVPSDPTNFSMAQSLSNIWLLIKNLSTRVKANEACCGSSCDDITIGFITDIEGTSAILRFTIGAGTFIPIGYTDCGSTLVVTNALGTSTANIPLVVSQGGETDEIDLSMFTIGEVLNFNIDLKMCSESQSCQKCINKDVKYVNSACCVLTNDGVSDLVITYSSLV